jgi:glycosyltransferase involved in cell wall biosynthesis
MARIVLADDGIAFDGRTLESRPLGGAETAFASLARALAARGHEVAVHNRCVAPMTADGVTWTPLAPERPDGGLPETADLYVANRGDKLLPLLGRARRRAFWIHNPARYLLKWRYLSKLWRLRPVIVFIGDFHLGTCPRWVPDGGRRVIPYGISDVFRAGAPRETVPGPRAIFTSNPLRSLDWLLDLWASRIRPRVPGAELHVFSGAATYGRVGEGKAPAMAAAIARAKDGAAHGVVVHEPVAKARLAEELRLSRVMLYRGDANETFCLAVGEAQAAGVPAVVGTLGSVAERVVGGETGFVAGDDASFAEAAVRLLADDGLWRRQHRAALDLQRRWGWDDAAGAFEDLIP